MHEGSNTGNSTVILTTSRNIDDNMIPYQITDGNETSPYGVMFSFFVVHRNKNQDDFSENKERLTFYEVAQKGLVQAAVLLFLGLNSSK